MSNKEGSRLEKWRAKYDALLIALSCLISLITSWGSSWVLSGILLLGVLICGTMGIFDIKRVVKEENIKRD